MKDEHKQFLAKYGNKEDLDRLANDDNWTVRHGVARNPNATKEHLDKLVNDPETFVRGSVAKNPNATKEHLDKLAEDHISWVEALAKSKLKERFPK